MTAELCPHCGAPQRDLWDHDWGGGGEDIETDCGACSRPIVISRMVDVTYRITTKEPADV